ncbi:MAG TPA: iron ABC transporter permease [Candidatus Limnocylindria bacterium]|nr:iron ABC transporter permease [Candidatus Limnocylindria bacterium]
MAASAGVLLALVGAPLAMLAWQSVSDKQGLTLDGYTAVVGRSLYYQSLINTLEVGIGSAALSVLIGAPLAWFVARTDMPRRGLVRTLVTASYVAPPFLLAIAYVILMAPNTGALNRAIVALTGVERGPFNAYSLGILIFVTGLHTFPAVFLLTVAALESLDGSLEQAARILGAGKLRTTLKITLPLVLPSVLGGALLAFVTAIALFGSQAILGIPGRVYTLPTRVYQVLGYPPDYTLASALSMLLVALTVIALALQRRWVGRRVATIGARTTPAEPLGLGRWRWLALAASALVILVAIVLPYGALGAVSLMRAWPAGLVAANLTLDNYAQVLFGLEVTRRAIGNSLLLGALTATITMVLGVVIATIDLRTALRGKRVLDYLSVIPLGVPGIVLAVAILELWLRLPVNLYGTLAILLLAYLTRFVPLAVRSSQAAISQVDTSLEEAARIGGASWWTTERRVTLPLAAPALVAGWILVFVPTLQELSASVLLFTPDTMTLAVTIFNFQDNGKLELVSALGVVMLVLVTFLVALTRRFAGRPVVPSVRGV